ncbi:MAG: hypothetical protein JRJ83_18165 [Deltaproteobacteria bacterium]|nr:hypothetical protein [Deltaproteobacteria bacterium]
MEIHTALSKQPAVLLACSTLSTDTNMTGTWRRIQMLTGRGAFRDAVETILLENPFPATCGRVCFQFCEGACNRASFDDPVGIRYVERFLGDMALAEGWARVPLKEPETPRKAAVIGAGPAGAFPPPISWGSWAGHARFSRPQGSQAASCAGAFPPIDSQRTYSAVRWSASCGWGS